MKRIIVFVILTTIYATLYCQNPKSFISKKKLWVMLEYSSPELDRCCSNSAFKQTTYNKISDDTLIRSKIFNKVLSSTDSMKTWVTIGYLREDTLGNVFFMAKDSEKDTLVYSFVLKQNDTLENGYIVNNVDSILIDGVKRSRFSLSKKQTPIKDVWIEGIGSIQNQFMHPLKDCACPGASKYVTLLCYFENDKLVYHDSHFNDCYYALDEKNFNEESGVVYPNPAGNMLCFEDKLDRNSIIKIYDAKGDLQLSKSISNCADVSTLMPGYYSYSIFDTKKLKYAGSFIKN